MIIGIDIDGVLTDIEQWQLDYGSKFCYEKYGKELKNNEGYNLTDIFEIGKKEDDEFWEEYFLDYVKNEPARKFADEVTHKLHEDENKIYIITARYLTDRSEEMRKLVENWLDKYNIYYDKLIFSPEDKLDICLENKVDLMIEDKPENINTISTKIPVICFNAGYNKQCSGENIIRCYSWYDIYQKINAISGHYRMKEL